MTIVCRVALSTAVQTKLVLDSPMRMQRLMSAANSAKTLQLPSIAHEKDVPK